MTGIKSVFGGAGIREGSSYANEDGLKQLFKILKQYEVTTIDTAQLYGISEETLGKAKAGDQFIVDTKATGGFVAGSGTKSGIIEGVKESQKKLGMQKVWSVCLQTSPYLILPGRHFLPSCTRCKYSHLRDPGRYQRGIQIGCF